MKQIGVIFVGILAVFLFLGGFASPITDGIKTWRTTNSTQSFARTTGAGVTTSNVTLSYDLYQAATAEVIGISSNETSDAPVATTYVEATKVLLVSGLAESKTRTLAVNYYAESESQVMRVLGPFLMLLIFGAILYGIGAMMFSKKGRR